MGRPLGTALVRARSDRLGGLQLDQGLQHQLQPRADHVEVATGAKCVQQLGQGILIEGHRVLLMRDLVGHAEVHPVAPSVATGSRNSHHSTGRQLPPRFRTDFASVPRVVTWLIPRYGRYTKAAILHDYLCDVEVRRETITRADADGVFRRALRELGVAFLRRWLMWAAVRLGGAKEHPSTLWRPGSRPLARWILIAVPGLLFAALPVIAILAALGLFFLAECIVLAILEGGARRDADGTPLKEINEPKFPWTT